MSRNETTGSEWDDVTDATFFRITCDLFSHGFLAGASVLLASYDDALVLAGSASSVPAPAAVSRRPQNVTRTR